VGFVLLLCLPFLSSLPTALRIGELASALPAEGGFYVWVRRALGSFWGLQEAWLSLAASIFDMANYPALFTLYLGRLAHRSRPDIARYGGHSRAGGMPALEPAWCALMLSYTRVPVALARDGLLPRVIARHNRAGAPWVAIMLCAVPDGRSPST
jgi:amino acid transporter